MRVQRGQILQRRKDGAEAEVLGFTTKPRPQAASDGVRRVRLAQQTGRVTTPKVDGLERAYSD